MNSERGFALLGSVKQLATWHCLLSGTPAAVTEPKFNWGLRVGGWSTGQDQLIKHQTIRTLNQCNQQPNRSIYTIQLKLPDCPV